MHVTIYELAAQFTTDTAPPNSTYTHQLQLQFKVTFSFISALSSTINK